MIKVIKFDNNLTHACVKQTCTGMSSCGTDAQDSLQTAGAHEDLFHLLALFMYPVLPVGNMVINQQGKITHTCAYFAK